MTAALADPTRRRILESLRAAPRTEDDFTLMMPLVRWLNRALGLKPATAR